MPLKLKIADFEIFNNEPQSLIITAEFPGHKVVPHHDILLCKCRSQPQQQPLLHNHRHHHQQQQQQLAKTDESTKYNPYYSQMVPVGSIIDLGSLIDRATMNTGNSKSSSSNSDDNINDTSLKKYFPTTYTTYHNKHTKPQPQKSLTAPLTPQMLYQAERCGDYTMMHPPGEFCEFIRCFIIPIILHSAAI